MDNSSSSTLPEEMEANHLSAADTVEARGGRCRDNNGHLVAKTQQDILYATQIPLLLLTYCAWERGSVHQIVYRETFTLLLFICGVQCDC